MSDRLHEHADLPSSDPPIETIEEVLREQYGLSGQIFPIEGRQNPYFLIDNGHTRYLLKVTPAGRSSEEIKSEHALMRHFLRSPDGPQVPEPIADRNGEDTVAIVFGSEERLIRLLTFIEGTSPPADEELSGEAIAAFGSLSAAVAKSLEDFVDPIPEREPEGDLRKAGPQTVALLSAVTDHERRDVIAKVMVTSLRRIQPLGPALRLAAVHHDLTGNAVAGDAVNGPWKPRGLTDFSAISKGWLVAGFANTCAYLLANRKGDVFSLLPAVRAYHDIHPLTLSELEALWPLVVARTGILAAEAESRLVQFPDDPQALEETQRRRALLEAATSVSPDLVFAAFLDATGMKKPLPEMRRLLPDIDPDTIRLVDLGIASPLLHAGNWTNPENDWAILARIANDTGRACTRYGEYRLSKSSVDPDREPESFALHIDLCVPAGSVAVAPFAGALRIAGSRLAFSGSDLTLHIEGLRCEFSEGSELAAGEPLGVVAGDEGAVGGLRLRLSRDRDLVPPLFCTPAMAGSWSNLCPSPATLLGVEANAPPPLLHPDRHVRGWKEHLFDAAGRSFLDLSGNAPLPGHGHPRVAAVVYRQLLLLDRAPFGPLETQELLAEGLKNHAPNGLDAVFLLARRQEAFDFAFGLARAHKQRNDIVRLGSQRPMSSGQAVLEADSMDNAAAALNAGDKAALLLADVIFQDDGMSGLLDAARRHESLVIVDETYTGWGRLGNNAWGCDAQGIAPDLVVAGFPGLDMAVVFARKTIAAGSTPLTGPPSLSACVAAAALLDICEEEELRDNAQRVGQELRAMLEDLAARHQAIRRVRSAGLFLKLETADENAAGAIQDGLREKRILTTTDGHGALTIMPPLCFTSDSAHLLIRSLDLSLSKR